MRWLACSLTLTSFLVIGCGGGNKVEMPTDKVDVPKTILNMGGEGKGAGPGFPKLPDGPPPK